jgi:hypothetical protein
MERTKTCDVCGCVFTTDLCPECNREQNIRFPKNDSKIDTEMVAKLMTINILNKINAKISVTKRKIISKDIQTILDAVIEQS